MKVHAIVDYSFLYYKYTFQLDSGKVKRLTFNEPNCAEEKDISQMYYSIKEIEGFRKNLEKYGHDVTVSVCFDMPSDRKVVAEGASDSEIEAANNYKSNRIKRLTDTDFENMQIVESMLSQAGYNTYRIVGAEADDLISSLVYFYREKFDFTVIYTPDADLLINIQPGVGAMRYKTGKGYQQVDINNYEEYLSNEFKCYIPYNALMLFKATCGDSSDKIAGIKKFGPKAFDKLVSYLNTKGIDWSDCNKYNTVFNVIQSCKGYLSDEQIQQATESLSLVRPMVFEAKDLGEPVKTSTKEQRVQAYSRYCMVSLYD